MDAFNTTRAELRKMKKRYLLELTRRQERRWCNVGARECGFLIRYGDFGFCLTELLGKGCSPHLELEEGGGKRAEGVSSPCRYETEG